MGKKSAIVWSRFEAGWATDLKAGLKGSFAYSQAFDFRKSPTQMSVLPAMRREDAGVVTDLIQNTIMDQDGSIYALGNTGKFYRRNSSGSWSAEASLSDAAVGLDIRRDANMLLIAGTRTVSRYGPLQNSPAMNPDAYASSISLSNNTTLVGYNVSANQEGSLAAYTIPTAISEAMTDLRYFQSDIEPLSKISLFVVTKGTGDWTVTLHDGLNNVLATSTVTNANLNAGSWNDFNFSSQIRIYVAPNARTYHYHVTSTIAGGTLSCSTAGNLSTGDLRIYADRLIASTNGYHSIVRFQEFECIANGNYLSIWEPLNLDSPSNDEWQRHRLTFPQELDMIGVAGTNEFLVMALSKGSEGILAFWDGTSRTYNFVMPIPEGAPQGLHTYKNEVFYYAGGDWWVTNSLGDKPVKLRSMPGSATEYSGAAAPITVYPYAAAVRRGVHLFAWPSVTTSTAINFGVYSYGQTDRNWPNSFGYNYVMSGGSQNYSAGNNLQIGGLWSYGDTLLMSWRDTLNGGYGVDVVNNASVPAGTAIWESLIVDSGYPNKQQVAHFIDAYYSLPAGATITLAYKLDREANWHVSEAYSTANLWDGQAGYCKFNIDTPQRCREVQMQITITSDSSVTTPPAVYCASIVVDTLKDEVLI